LEQVPGGAGNQVGPFLWEQMPTPLDRPDAKVAGVPVAATQQLGRDDGVGRAGEQPCGNGQPPLAVATERQRRDVVQDVLPVELLAGSGGAGSRLDSTNSSSADCSQIRGSLTQWRSRERVKL
jgi:hypothetical protein